MMHVDNATAENSMCGDQHVTKLIIHWVGRTAGKKVAQSCSLLVESGAGAADLLA